MKKRQVGFMVFGFLFVVLFSFGLSWAQNPPVLLVVVRASDDSLWKMTCDEAACSPFSSFPGLFRYQPTVTWDEKAQEWVVVGTAAANTIWMATFDKNGNFNNDWQYLPGLTPSPAGASGSFYTLGSLSCSSGQIPKWNGSAWVCANDEGGAGGDITSVTAGTGLAGGGTSGDVTLNVNTAAIQSRVTGSCASGSSIRVINTDGTVTCQADTDSGGDITGVSAGTGLTGGGTSGDVALSVNFAGSGSATTVSKSDHDHFSGAWEGNNAQYGLFVNNLGTGDGIRGYSSGSVFNYAGVYAENSSTGSGVFGHSASGFGIYGRTFSSSGYAGYFDNTGGGTGINARGGTGVYGESPVAAGNGIVGVANGGSAAYGVWGQSSSGYAGVFSGNVSVLGTLYKSSGSFKIDHPLDPANKYLYHSFVESPDMKNIYDGVVEIDQYGEAIVMLPEWFGALNRDFRYQLTCIGGYAPVYIAEEITDNRFRISGGTPSLKVSWQITGIRQDKWANDHRIPVEEAKPSGEIGTYLHPQGFGQSDELRVDGARIKALKSRAPKPLEDVNKNHSLGIGVKP